MYIRFHLKVVTALIFASTILACSDLNDFPNEPTINSVTWDASQKNLVVRFTDGDGDFGIDGDDPRFPLYINGDSSTVNPYYYNFWIDYFEKREGAWVLVQPLNTFNWRVPVLTPTGQNKQLDVIFTYDLSAEIPFVGSQSDTIMFRVVLVDRALNESLPQETEPIILP